MYKCKQCNTPVLVVPNEKPVRACNCNAPIIATMEATVIGVGGIKF